MNRKYMPLMIGGGVILLLAMGLIYLLFRAEGRYADGFAGLASVQNQLQRLTSRAVFPSDGNVQSMRKQLAIYQEYLDGLKSAMKKGQPTTEAITRDRFRQLAEEKLRTLVDDARKKSVVLPPNFAFGFQRYAEGNIPTDEEMGRLVDQFRSIAALCEILYDAGIGELVAVDRTVFEKDAQASPVEEPVSHRTLRNRTDAAAPALPSSVPPSQDGWPRGSPAPSARAPARRRPWRPRGPAARGPRSECTRLQARRPRSG